MADTALVSGSRFEELLIKIHKDEEANLIKLRNEEEANLASKLNQGRRRDLFKVICSAFFFLRKVAGMTKRDMTLEEFEIVEEKLREMAEKEIQKPRHKIFKLFSFKTAWVYYHEYGYFHIRKTPFGSWWKKHPWYKNNWSDFNQYNYVDISDSYSIPPNARSLLEK